MTHPPLSLSVVLPYLLSLICYLLSIICSLPPLPASASLLDAPRPGLDAWCVDPCGARPVLPDDDGATALSGGLDAVAAGGSVATLSLAVKSATPVSSLSVSCDGLACGERKLPASAVDLLLVKCWYQDGNAWFTELRDPSGRILIPELLLHDDALVVADEKTRANLVRAGGKAVAAAEVKVADHDAPSLRPFALRAGEVRQLLVRIAIAPGTPPGIYRGQLAFAADGAPAGRAALTLRVLAYDLPRPRARFADADYLFVSPRGWPALPSGIAPLPAPLDARALAEDGYAVGEKEDENLAASKKYHVFRAPATRRQLQARRAIGAVALEAAPPLAGIENPAPWRRKKGVAAWLRGYGGILVPALAEAASPWNDDHGDTRSRTLLYPAADGSSIPTLASVALEEAWFDVCYLSALNERARELLSNADTRLAVEGRRALAWLADIDASPSAPATVRLDAIAWLERLRAILTPSKPNKEHP